MKSNYWKSESGKKTIIAILYIVLLGIILAWVSIDSDSAVLLVIPCAYFGWQTLNRIQPSMFLWMSWLGWLVYFIVKFVLSWVVGVFVTPMVLGNKIYEKWFLDKSEA